ncbi:Dam family site-specific DNA-(adenine-N6)-methyltransferase [Hymenobacter sp. HSC-4F20]|uniref:Dam family site-specific DNA-(adenine-N6)-methyltransferase n=1 Tax=Hymenobacter sp. HSC-4F20 TaxID=2864135 RepID=UPI001DF6A0EC|nr:Dam family site-specific DNA-(adenine-N6)-methyltransferase [Hymenobacter sp. HSC-4F20]MBX0289693.1 Dam family site-specific DNA-(adenine-N6)-methyltransferase [Hymenobacter sp. HSC-4F20]
MRVAATLNLFDHIQAKPVLKWAGGKAQLLKELHKSIPKSFNKYIEPFFGGGALFFNLTPEKAIIADLNPELVNLYKCLKEDPEQIIKHLSSYINSEEFFYQLRSTDVGSLDPFQTAARTIYLNKTCFNGLYRVNKKGQFNVPYGRYVNPNICDTDTLLVASQALQHASINCGDYKAILNEHAEPGDLIFLDPPYLPISKYSDFKRYTKEQFYEEDHKELAAEVQRLHELGCHVILTNSNHPLVHTLYSNFKIEVVKTKRFINSDAGNRTGEDIIVTVPPKPTSSIRIVPDLLPNQVDKYPSTRWMGSKSKLLSHIQLISRRFEFDTAMDLFSGSGIVGYMLKSMGKEVISNDYMHLSGTYTKAMVENNSTKLSKEKAEGLLNLSSPLTDCFVQETFQGLYFTDEENLLIDILRSNIKRLSNKYEKAIALSALMRACTKKRPRGIFTYVGNRYDDGRKDLQLSLAEQFLKAVEEINEAVFDNGRENISRVGDAMNIRKDADLVYIDPPYFSPLSDNEYVRRYHFIEGLACDWEGLEIQWHTKTRKFKNYPTPFSSQKGAYDAFDKLFKRFKDSILLVSYSSNSLPTLDEMVGLMSKYKSHVEVEKIDYRYSFGTQKEGATGNSAQEYIFIGY